MMESSIFFTSPEMPQASVLQIEPLSTSARGFSELYRANRDGKFRVLKALKNEYRGNPIFETLLRKEFEIGYQLDHPAICGVLAYTSVEGLGNCIEMEWVDGCTLTRLLAEGPLGRELEEKIICELCDALSYIHHKQIIHRDLKPDNILITHNGKNVKIIDFGLSDSDYHSSHKESAGTVVYAAPELLKGEEVTSLADIYSVGEILKQFSGRYASVARICTGYRPESRYQSAEAVKIAVLRCGVRRWWLAAAIAVAIAMGLGAYFLPKGEDAAPAPTQAASDAAQDVESLFNEVSSSIEEAVDADSEEK